MSNTLFKLETANKPLSVLRQEYEKYFQLQEQAKETADYFEELAEQIKDAILDAEKAAVKKSKPAPRKVLNPFANLAKYDPAAFNAVNGGEVTRVELNLFQVIKSEVIKKASIPKPNQRNFGWERSAHFFLYDDEDYRLHSCYAISRDPLPFRLDPVMTLHADTLNPALCIDPVNIRNRGYKSAIVDTPPSRSPVSFSVEHCQSVYLCNRKRDVRFSYSPHISRYMTLREARATIAG